MKKISITLILLFILFSCNKSNKNLIDNEVQGENVLLAENVEITNLVELENKNNSEWLKGFNRKEFVNTVFENVYSGKFTECYSRYDSLIDSYKYTVDEIEQRMITTYYFNEETTQKDTVINETKSQLSQILEFLFKEEWEFNTNSLQFRKKVLAWAPVRNYFHEGEFKEEDKRRKIVFWVNGNRNSNPKVKIAEDFTYAFQIDRGILNTVYKRDGFDKRGFIEFILNHIQEGKIIAYDPIWLIDRSKREFTLKELQNYAGISLDAFELNNELNKLIFVEDWYFNEETFEIRKKVKALGFVAERYQNEEVQDRILFFIFLNHSI